MQHPIAISYDIPPVYIPTWSVPALYILGDGYTASPRIRAGVAAALSHSARGSSAWHLQGAEHGNFVDAPLWAPLWRGGAKMFHRTFDGNEPPFSE